MREGLLMPPSGAKIHVKDGAILCPVCSKPIKGLRIYPDTQLTRANVRCSCCKRTFDLTIRPGQRPDATSAIVLLL